MCRWEFKQVLSKSKYWGFLGKQKMCLRIKVNWKTICNENCVVNLIGLLNLSSRNVSLKYSKMMKQRNENRILKIKSSIGISIKEVINQLWQSLSKSIIDCRLTVIHSYFLPFIWLNWATQFLVSSASSHSVCENGWPFSNRRIKKVNYTVSNGLGYYLLK